MLPGFNSALLATLWKPGPTSSLGYWLSSPKNFSEACRWQGQMKIFNAIKFITRPKIPQGSVEVPRLCNLQVPFWIRIPNSLQQQEAKTQSGKHI